MFKQDNCIFSYSISTIFCMGIIAYIYMLIIDAQEEEDDRNKSETVVIWCQFILLILGLILSSYCVLTET